MQDEKLLNRLLRSQHDHILTLYGMSLDAPDGKAYLVMEHCPNGTLENMLRIGSHPKVRCLLCSTAEADNPV